MALHFLMSSVQLCTNDNSNSIFAPSVFTPAVLSDFEYHACHFKPQHYLCHVRLVDERKSGS